MTNTKTFQVEKQGKLTGIIGYSSVPDSNGDTGVYVIPQYGLRERKIVMDRKIVVLTPAQCELIASALEVINPDDAEMEKQARALAIQFRSELD